MSEKLILVVNTGSTTTKCSLFTAGDLLGKGGDVFCAGPETCELFRQDIQHPDDLIHKFDKISDQVNYREDLVRQFISENLPLGAEIVAIGAIGGMLPPVPSGVILLNDQLAEFSINTPVYQHASNLAAGVSYRLGESYNIPAFVVDPVGVDEMRPIARISGCPEFPRFSFGHPLNIRATIRKLARNLGLPFDEIRAVGCHLGGGFSIAPFDRGKIVDSDNRMEAAPFTPERAGGLPPIPILDACFSGKYKRDELHKMLYGAGGIYAYLGTKDMKEIAKRIKNGDHFARFIVDAMIYQICKEIGAMASVLDFDFQGIVVTGGIAHDPYITGEITRKCSKLAKVYIYPGENENEAIAESVWMVLNGFEKARQWPDCILKVEEIDPLYEWRKNNL